MKKLKLFMAVPVMALSALLTLSACSDDTTTILEGGPDTNPIIALQDPAVSRAGIAIPVSVAYADKIHYAVLFKAADATADPTPTPADYKYISVDDITNETLLIPADKLEAYGTYCIYTYASTRIAKSEVAKTTAVFTEDKFEELLSMEVKNLTAYSLDVDVKMSAICDKYVVTVYREDTWFGDKQDTKTDFLDSSRRSIDPDENQLQFGTQSFAVFSQSALIPEAKLSKNTPYNTEECEGFKPLRISPDQENVVLKYVVVAYGIDKFGKDKIYVSDAFELPEAVFTTDPVVEITPITTLSKASAIFNAPSNYVKIVYGSVAAVQSGSDFPVQTNNEFWNDREKSIALLKQLPLAYTPIPVGKSVMENQRQMNIVGKPGEKTIVYAFGVTADGKIGPMNYVIGTYQSPILDGEATIKSLKARSTTFDLKLFWDVVYSPNTTAVRFLVAPKGTFDSAFTGSPQKEMEFKWMMCTNESTDGYGWWKQYSTAELHQINYCFASDVNWYEEQYVIYAVARDGAGKWGEVFKGETQYTGSEPAVDKSIDFSKGTGAMTLNIKSMIEDPADAGCSIGVYSVAKGANTSKIYRLPFTDNQNFQEYSDLTYAKVLEAVKTRVDKDSIKSQFSMNFDTDYSTPSGGMFFNPNSWGLSFLVFVTEDTSGNYAIKAIVAAGQSTPITF